jgi:hypothetical protein
MWTSDATAENCTRTSAAAASVAQTARRPAPQDGMMRAASCTRRPPGSSTYRRADVVPFIISRTYLEPTGNRRGRRDFPDIGFSSIHEDQCGGSHAVRRSNRFCPLSTARWRNDHRRALRHRSENDSAAAIFAGRGRIWLALRFNNSDLGKACSAFCPLGVSGRSPKVRGRVGKSRYEAGQVSDRRAFWIRLQWVRPRRVAAWPLRGSISQGAAFPLLTDIRRGDFSSEQRKGPVE